VYGGYSELLESSPVDFGSGMPDAAGDRLQYDHFVAGVLVGCDVDPSAWIPGVTPFAAFLR
jgi:hypothetical protein